MRPPRLPAGVQGSWQQLMWRVTEHLSNLGDELLTRVQAMSDQREKLLRRRLRARRWSIRWALACLVGVMLTSVFATTSAPFWLLIIPAVLTAACAIPAVMLFFRYRHLKREPLPPARPGIQRRLPPRGSAARQPMAALDAAERGLFSLLGVVERGSIIPQSEGQQILMAANQAASVMSSTAKEIVAMERAAALTPHTREYLRPTIDAFTAQLDAGMHQYRELVTAAAQLVSAGDPGAVPGGGSDDNTLFDDLVSATDRLTGWADAFDELGRLSG